MRLVVLAHDVPFWPTLWPALLATIAGVVAGLPIALWLSGIGRRHARSQHESERVEALARAAQALRESVTWNGEKARVLAEGIQKGHVPFDVPLETERWQAVREEFVRTANNAELQGRVAFFFDKVRRAAQMADRRLEYTVGVPSATTHAAEVAKALTGQLLQDLPALEHEAKELDQVLKELEPNF